MKSERDLYLLDIYNEYLNKKSTIDELANREGVSRRTIFRWFTRFREKDKKIINEIDKAMEDKINKLEKEMKVLHKRLRYLKEEGKILKRALNELRGLVKDENQNRIRE